MQKINKPVNDWKKFKINSWVEKRLKNNITLKIYGILILIGIMKKSALFKKDNFTDDIKILF